MAMRGSSYSPGIDQCYYPRIRFLAARSRHQPQTCTGAPQCVLGGDLELPAISEKRSVTGGEQANDVPLRVLIPAFRRIEQRVEMGSRLDPNPPAAARKETAMAAGEFDTCQAET
jgi:hypothetical protein